MRFKIIYNLGSIILFLGLFWMLLPHAFHEKIIGNVVEESHIAHTIQGLIIAILGLIIMAFTDKKIRQTKAEIHL